MKRKLLFAMLCIVSALGLRAQEDITSTYLTNADLSTVDNGWTYYSDAYKYQAWRNSNTETLVPAVEFYSGWGSLEHTNFKFSQTITLPAGDYRIAVNAFYREGNNGDGTNNNKAWIFAGETKQNVYALSAADATALRDYTNGDDMDDAKAMFHDGKFSNAFDFSLTEETVISLGFEGVFNTKQSWCILGPVKLYKYSLDDYLADYDSKYAEAQTLTGKPMNADVQSALTAAMVDRNSFSLSSQVTAAITALTTAVNNAKASIDNYAAIKAVMDENDTKITKLDSYGTEAYATAAATALNAYNNGTATDGATEIAALKAAYKTAVLATKQPADGADMTPYITNSNFDGGTTDGWTLEVPLGGNHGIQGGSRLEYWAGNASNRAEASFNYYQELSNLPAGVYTVGADMYNSLNGEGGDYTVFSPTCGIYGVSSNEEVALVDADGDVLNPYTTGEILVFRGKMTVGAKNTVTPIAARWFVFDNVKLTYVRQLTQEEIDANTVPESISLDVTSAPLTIYGTQTLTATILPDNANDKTITWTSSNEKVATVSNGVVTAVGVGTATITATANGADDVKTTATVTVTDVTPAAAPAFYSTEIASGTDYYIVNAATGTFLGGGNAWGTQASLIEHGIPFGAKMNNGTYTLDSYTYNSQDDHFVNGTYVDGAATNLYITSVGNGKFTISTANGSAYMTAKPGSAIVDNSASNTSSVLSHWYFLSKADRDKMLAGATAENPADATYYVKQANISRNRSAGGYNVNAWSQYSVGGTQDNSNNAAQVYNEAVDNYQTIENIPNGTYVVAVQAFTSGTGVKFYANDAKVDVLAKPDGVSTPSAAAALFAQKQYTNTVNVTVTNNTLKIGFEGDCSGAKWLCYDDVTLYMTNYYDASATMEITDALYATFVAPFDVTIPEGVTAYTVDGVESNGTTLTMTEVTTTIPANTPVVLSAEAAVAAQTFAGKSVAGEAKAGLLTGVYEATEAPVGSYVLQNNEDKVGFYVVGSTIPTIGANRAYLTVPSTGVKAFFFDNATAIQGVEAEKENGAIFNLAGQRVNKAQKGIYIMNGKKVMVK